MFDALNVELEKHCLDCVHTCVEINNIIFELLLILNLIKILFNSNWILVPKIQEHSFIKFISHYFIKLLN